MARHQGMPTEEAGYTYAVEPTATNRLLANEEESIYRLSKLTVQQPTVLRIIRCLPTKQCTGKVARGSEGMRRTTLNKSGRKGYTTESPLSHHGASLKIHLERQESIQGILHRFRISSTMTSREPRELLRIAPHIGFH